MVWQPTQRVWAGDDLKVEEHELEVDAMQGVESTHGTSIAPASTKSATGSGSGAGSARSQSMSMSASASASVSGADADEDDA